MRELHAMVLQTKTANGFQNPVFEGLRIVFTIPPASK